MTELYSSVKTIMVVEDDYNIQCAIKEGLELEGYNVVTANNGKDGLEKLRLDPQPRLVLLDFMMPIMGGREFLDKLMEDPVLKYIPVVVISAATGRYGTNGAVETLPKPLDLNEMLDVVAQYTG